MEAVLQTLSFEARALLVRALYPRGILADEHARLTETSSPIVLCFPDVINGLIVHRLCPFARWMPVTASPTVISTAKVLLHRDPLARRLFDELYRMAKQSRDPQDTGIVPYFPTSVSMVDWRPIPDEFVELVVGRMPPFHLVTRVYFPATVVSKDTQRKANAAGLDVMLIHPGSRWEVFGEVCEPTRVLALGGPVSFSEHDLAHLCRIRTLEELRITGMTHMCSLQPVCTSNVRHLVLNAPHDFRASRDMGGSGWSAPQLRTLELRGCGAGVTDSIWGHIAAFAPNLESLSVEKYVSVTGDGVSALYTCKALRVLSVSGTAFRAEHLPGINALTSLEELCLSGTDVRRKADIVATLAQHPTLKTVTVTVTTRPVDPADAAHPPAQKFVFIHEPDGRTGTRSLSRRTGAAPASSGTWSSATASSKKPTRPTVVGAFDELP